MLIPLPPNGQQQTIYLRSGMSENSTGIELQGALAIFITVIGFGSAHVPIRTYPVGDGQLSFISFLFSIF